MSGRFASGVVSDLVARAIVIALFCLMVARARAIIAELFV